MLALLLFWFRAERPSAPTVDDRNPAMSRP